METTHLYKTKKELIEESSKRGITVKQLIAEIKATAIIKLYALNKLKT